MTPVSAVRPYLTLLVARCRQETQYRAAALFGMATQLFWGLVRIAIFTAFLKAGGNRSSMSLPQTVTYLWLVQGMIRVMPWSVDAEIRNLVHEGTVVYELLRPIDLYFSWYMRAFARHAIPTIMRAIPLFVAAVLLFHMQMPPTVSAGALFVTGVVLALLLAAAISTLINISLLFTISGDGIQRILPAIANFASGLLIPLSFLPSALRRVLRILPFCSLIDTPARFYLGQIGTPEAASMFAQTLIWILALSWFGRFLILRASERMVVQGG